jgi:hypothetical protein
MKHKITYIANGEERTIIVESPKPPVLFSGWIEFGDTYRFNERHVLLVERLTTD